MYNDSYATGLSDLVVIYEQYVQKAQNEGKKPVSLLKFAFGNF